MTLAAYPLVPKDEVGFRIQVTAANTDEQITRLIEVLGELADRFPLQPRRRVPGAPGACGVRRPTGSIADRAWIAYLGLAAVASSLYLFVPGLQGSAPLSQPHLRVVGRSRSSSASGFTALRRPWPWRWFAIGQALFFLGDVYTYSYPHRDRPRGAVPVCRGRALPPGVPGADDRRAARRAAAQPAGRSRRSDRRADHHRRHRAALVGLPDGARTSTTRRSRRSRRRSRSPTRSATSSCSRLRCASPSTEAGARASFVLLAASVGALLATDAAYGYALLDGTYNHQLDLRRRVARLLPPVGRSGTASVHAASSSRRRRTASAGCPGSASAC